MSRIGHGPMGHENRSEDPMCADEGDTASATECLGCEDMVWSDEEFCPVCGHPNDHYKAPVP